MRRIWAPVSGSRYSAARDSLKIVSRSRSTISRVALRTSSASHETDTRYEALNLGANDFLTKPVDRIEFLARSRNMLALQRTYPPQRQMGPGPRRQRPHHHPWTRTHRTRMPSRRQQGNSKQARRTKSAATQVLQPINK